MLATISMAKIVIYKHSLNEFEKEYLPVFLENISHKITVQEDAKKYTLSSFHQDALYRALIWISEKCDIEIM